MSPLLAEAEKSHMQQKRKKNHTFQKESLVYSMNT